MKKSLLLAALCVACMATSASANPWGWAFGPVNRYVGPQIRQANPYAYSGLLALNRSIPPQVKNNWNNQLNPYRSGNPWSMDLNYIRSMPPEVRNNLDRAQRQQRQMQMGYAQPQPPTVIYVPVPVAPTGAAHLNVPTPGLSGTVAPAAIPAPPPPSELPRIVRPY